MESGMERQQYIIIGFQNNKAKQRKNSKYISSESSETTAIDYGVHISPKKASIESCILFRSTATVAINSKCKSTK